jgi:hypothetical protein
LQQVFASWPRDAGSTNSVGTSHTEDNVRWLHQTAPPKPKKRIAAFDSRLTFSLLWHSMAKLYFYYSSMNAGKSTALLQSSYNYKERGMRTIVLAPDLDDR